MVINMNTQSNELNDLFDYDYKIYQNKEFFKFSIDSVLLAELVEVKKNKRRLLDMCSGNAPVPLILNKKYGDLLDITAVELQDEVYELGKLSLEYNNVNNINYIKDDVNNLPFMNIKNKFNYITCNPPYFKVEEDSKTNDNKIKAIARHEITVDLESIIKIASKLIENGGYFYMVHRPNRLDEIMSLFNKYNFGIKKIIPVYNDINSECTFVLIESMYNGKNYVRIDKPVFIDGKTSYKDIFRK